MLAEASAGDPPAVALGWAEAAEEAAGLAPGHVRRVGAMAELLACKAGLGRRRAARLGFAAMLHDVGMLAVPMEVVLKPGALAQAELDQVRIHPMAGAEMLRWLDFPALEEAEQAASGHHERWDGSGYPLGLSGTDIPLPARVAGLADVLDTLTSPRPHKPAYPLRLAAQRLGRERGRGFDPSLVDVVLAYLEEFEGLCWSGEAASGGEAGLSKRDLEAGGVEAGGQSVAAGSRFI
jgi:putative two-component system response regulator